MATLSGSVLLGFLTEYLNQGGTPQIHAFLYALGIAFCAFAAIATGSSSYHIGWMLAMRIKIILTAAIYHKVCH